MAPSENTNKLAAAVRRTQARENAEKPSDVLARARGLADAGQYAEAISLLNETPANWHQAGPVRDELLGRIHLMSGDAATAVECLTRAREALVSSGRPLSRSWYHTFGSALVAQGRFEEGGKALSEAVAAGASINQPALQASIEAFRHANENNLDAGPPTPYRLLAQAELTARGRDFAGAAALLAAHRATFETVPPAYVTALERMTLLSGMSESDVLARARALTEEGKYGDAITLLQQARANWRDVPAVWDELLGRIHLMQGDSAEAIECLARAHQGMVKAGQKVPRSWFHAYGSALVAQGKFEEGGRALNAVVAAGGSISQPALLAAIEAFRHADETNLDGGPPTPYRILAQAESLARSRHFAEAAALLTDHRASFPSLPPNYEIALGRMMLLAGDPEASVSLLTRTAASLPDGLPREARQILGNALIDVGRFTEGGQELSRIAAEGATITRLYATMAINRYRSGAGEGPLLETRFPAQSTVLDPGRRIAYLSIPKNACTLLKATLVMNGPHRGTYLASGQSIHQFASALTRAGLPSEIITDKDYFRFVVLRDPHRRVLRAYLDTFVRERGTQGSDVAWNVKRTIRNAQALAGISYDPERSISFAEFVRYVSRADDLDCSVQWIPQVCLTGRDLGIYEHVGRVEKLYETLGLLEARFGMQPETDPAPHISDVTTPEIKYADSSTLENPFDCLPRALAACADGVPMPEQFYTAELNSLIQERYAEDVTLYARV